MKNCYLISGLGADERAFKNLKLNHNITHLPWLIPENNETIESYAKRMTGKINEPMPVLIGLSFGGMVAIEIAKQIQTDKVIIISSAKTNNEIPFYYRIAAKLLIHKALPVKLINKSGLSLSVLFNTGSPEEKEILRQMLKDSNSDFLKWAINCVVCWHNKYKLKNIYHIHGDADRVLPLKFIKVDRIVNGGGHMMIFNKADELNTIVEKVLSLDSLQ